MERDTSKLIVQNCYYNVKVNKNLKTVLEDTDQFPW